MKTSTCNYAYMSKVNHTCTRITIKLINNAPTSTHIPNTHTCTLIDMQNQQSQIKNYIYLNVQTHLELCL